MSTSSLQIVLTAVLVVWAGLVASCGDEIEETPPSATSTPGDDIATPQPTLGDDIATPQPTPIAEAPATSVAGVTPGTGVTIWRWADVSLLIPDQSGIFLNPGTAPDEFNLSPGTPVIEVIRHVDGRGNTSNLWIDATTGAVLADNVTEEDRVVFDSVLSTMSVAPLDKRAGAWPYSDEPPPQLERRNAAGVSYLLPMPSTGLYVSIGIADPGGEYIALKNERSTLFVSPNSNGDGFAADKANVAPEDIPAFDRWLTNVKACAGDSTC